MTLTASDQETTPGMGRYSLITRLARGGMGNVYLAALCRPGGFNKLLALKELKPELAEDESYVAMFVEEARMAARFVHPNIVQTNEIVSEENHHYMTMEFLDGRSLSRIVRRSTTGFPLGAQLRILGDALLGLHYAHELRGFDGEPLGIVHRDVSPLNIMVTFDGQTKVLDFGVAKAADSSLETKAGVLKGRIAYMAPEQAIGARVDRRADIYSIGVLIWEAAAGRRLWSEKSDVEILHRVVSEGPPRLRDVVPDAPAALDAICARAMAKSSADRYATAADLLRDLEAHLAQREDRMSMREIGELVSGIFADERRQMNQIIEEALARVGPRTRSGVVRALRASDNPSSASFRASEVGSLSDATGCAPEMSSAPLTWSDGPSNGSIRCTPLSKSEIKQSSSGTLTPSSQAIEAPRGGRNRRLVAGLVGAVFCLGIAVGLGSRLFSATRYPTAAGARATSVETAGAPVAVAAPALPPPPVTGTATALAPPQATAMASATLAVRQTKADSHEAAKTSPPPLKGHTSGKQAAPAPTSVAPSASTPAAESHSPAPAGSCNPPFTVDANGIEHFKTGCL